MVAKRSTRPSLPLIVYLLLAILLATVPVACLLSVFDAAAVRQELAANTEASRHQTESGVVLAVNLVDAGLKLFDKTLDRQMEEGFRLFIAEYISSTNPASSSIRHILPTSALISASSPTSTTGSRRSGSATR